jgi:hypothetical protein
MLVAVKDFKSHDYVVHNDRICYSAQDTLSSNIVFGYQTLFAYYHECAQERISRKSLEENIGIYIYLGNFSYAEIPRLFNCILGVTGTLKTLSNPEKKIVREEYNIINETYAASIYGMKTLGFNKNSDIHIYEKQIDYDNKLVNHITRKLLEGKRAVMVFFESKKKLRAFYNCSPLNSYRDDIVEMSEDTDEREKEMRILRAPTQGQITLLTKSYGRGTDFICEDPVVINNGGVHVVQTFLSEELSEETQIQGRTSRQGSPGSYSMFLLQSDLGKFHVHKDDVANAKCLYDMLNEKRNNFFKQQYSGRVAYVESTRKQHQSSLEFLQHLNRKDTISIQKFLHLQNKGAEIKVNSKIICLMDATNSMHHLLQKTKNTLETMFHRASSILAENSIAEGFEMQIVVFRNYNSSKELLLEASTWESKPENLYRFMKKIKCCGGAGNEAIEIGFWHVNREIEKHKISQVILIGDAPPNTPEEVKILRDQKGEQYWKNTRYGAVTTWENELKYFIGIPVNCLYVSKKAGNAFKKISSMTKGGKSAFLDVNDRKNGANMLTNLLTEEMLRCVGGEEKGDALVEAYKNKNWKKAFK